MLQFKTLKLMIRFVMHAGATVTFVRFFPTMKTRYDYGLLIFILTFTLVSVSSYREDKVLRMAHQRVTTIIMGSFIAIVTCICIRPIWIGEELQNLVANNIEKLGNFLQGIYILCSIYIYIYSKINMKLSCPIYKKHEHSITIVIFVLDIRFRYVKNKTLLYVSIYNVLVGGKTIFMFLKIETEYAY